MQLSIQSISKKYKKGKFGLQDFSLELESGIVGLLGPNGAGKSTLMKILATISKPTEGSLYLNGMDIISNPNAMRNILGYLPQEFGVYPNLNAFEFLEYIAALKGVGGKHLRKKIEGLLEHVNLIEAAKSPIGSYSGGMKQRIGIAQVLLNDPKIMIFDEPTVGLDPEERVRFRNLISDLAHDSIVILSSHIVSDIESIADTIAIMKSSKMLTSGSLNTVSKVADGYVYEVNMQQKDLQEFRSKYSVVNTARQEHGIRVRYLADHPVQNSVSVKETLEDAFLLTTKKDAS